MSTLAKRNDGKVSRGTRTLRNIKEPTAATIAYGLDKKETANKRVFPRYEQQHFDASFVDRGDHLRRRTRI